MRIALVPCWRCDGTGQATSDFHRRTPSIMEPNRVQYQVETERYSSHGWLFIAGACCTCNGTGQVVGVVDDD